MGNQIARSATEREPVLQISNGGAAVLFDLLALAACAWAPSRVEAQVIGMIFFSAES